MKSIEEECTLKDCVELKKMILEHPDLPLLIFCGEDAWCEDFQYAQAMSATPSIQKLTLYGDQWMDEDDYGEKLYDNLSDEEEYKNLTDEDYEKMIEQEIEETEFTKAIVIYVG